MRKAVPVIAAVVIVAFVVALILYRQGAPHTGPNVLRVSGNIEATEVDVSFRIPGWVKERPVDEGAVVKAGQLIARLDDVELVQQVAQAKDQVSQASAALSEFETGSRPQEIDQAKAAADKAQAALQQLETGSRPEEKEAAAANLASAEADAERARLDYERQKTLFQNGTISSQQFQAAESTYKVADAKAKAVAQDKRLVDIGPRVEEVEQGRAAAAQASAQYSLVKEGPRQEEIDQARARLGQATQALGIAQTHLDWATLAAPVGGVILSKNIEAGEYVVPGTPVVTIGDLAQVWLRAYVAETDLGRVKLGQSARVTTDTYRGKVYEGRIGFISSQAEFTPKNVETQKERVKLVYRIKIYIDNPSMELKPGMPADANIDLVPAK
jgi:HlyD family secretion protein